MDEAGGLDLNSRADHPEPSMPDPAEAVAATPSAVAEADRLDAGDGAGAELQAVEIGGQHLVWVGGDGGDLKMEMVERKSLECGGVVAGVRTGSGEVDKDDQGVPSRVELEKDDGSCGDVEMAVDVRVHGVGGSVGEGVTGLEISDQAEQIEGENEQELVEGQQSESVNINGVPCSDGGVQEEERINDETSEVQGSVAVAAFKSEGVACVADLGGMKVDVEEISNREEAKEEVFCLDMSAANDVTGGSEFASASGQTVIADEKRDRDIEVEALSAVENAEVVTPNGGQDSGALVEVTMLDNERTEVTNTRENTSYSEKSQADVSEAGLSGPDVATGDVCGDRELEMSHRSRGDEKIMPGTRNARSSAETTGVVDSAVLESLEVVTDMEVCNQAEFVNVDASSVEKGARLIGDVLELESRNNDQGLESTVEQEVELSELPSVAPLVFKTDGLEVPADLGDVVECHQEKQDTPGSGANILNTLVVVEVPTTEDMAGGLSLGISQSSEAEGMDRGTETIISITDNDQVGEHESVVLDLIDKNPDVQEVVNASTSEEEQMKELVPSDNNRAITLTKESDMANLVVKVHKGDARDHEAIVNIVPLIDKNLEVHEADAVLENEGVAKEESVPSVDHLSVPIMKDSCLANLVVKAHNTDSCPMSESVRDVPELIAAHSGSIDPVSAGDFVSTDVSENSTMDVDAQTLDANPVGVHVAWRGVMPSVHSVCSVSSVESENKITQLVDGNPDDGGDISNANPCLVGNDMMEIDQPKPSALSAVQSFTSQEMRCIDSSHTEMQEDKTTIALSDGDRLSNNPPEAVSSASMLSESVGLYAAADSRMLDAESMAHTTNASLGECCRYVDIVQNSEASAGLPFKGESELRDGSAFIDGDANFIMTEGVQDVMNTDLCNDDTDKVQVKKEKLLERVDADTEISEMENGQHAKYYVASQELGSVSAPDLVWGKVKSHPWWPGQIFGSSDASELAMKYQKKDNFLVAYFGDKTFAWCEESQLKPFLEYFSQMVNQSTSDAFINAVDDVLQEVFRRVQLGMACQCTPEETYADFKYQKIDNAGIRKGTSGEAFDRSQIVSTFQPDRLLLYIRTLAQFSKGETDRLDLVLAQAQLNAFYRSKSYSERPVLFLCGGLAENDDELLPSSGEISGQEQHYGKNKLRGRKNTTDKQNVVEEDSEQNVYELMEEETIFQAVDGDSKKSGPEASRKSYSRLSGRKHKTDDFDPTDLEKNKKERLDSLGDSKPKPSLIGSFKIGECIRRAASQLTGSTPILKNTGEALQKSVSKADHASFDVSGFDDSPHTPIETWRTKVSISDHNSSTSEMLSQLCLAARDPLKGYNFIPVIVNFFSDFRNSTVSDSFIESEPVEKIVSKRGRKKKTDSQPSSVPASSEISAPDYMSDSYWSDMLFHSSPESNLSPNGMKRRGSYLKSQRKKRKSLLEPTSSLQPEPMLGNAKQQIGNVGPNLKQELAAERPIIGLGRKYADDCTPTELILFFNKSDSLPSRTDLIRIFGHYGPLRESETEVMRKTNRVKVVFKRRADAEIAFSSAGKYSIFGPSLISYRLRYLSSTPKAPPETTPQDVKDAPLDITQQDALPDITQQNTEDAPAETNLQNAKDAPQDAKDANPCTTPDAPPNEIPQEAEDTPAEGTHQDTNDATPDAIPETPQDIMPQYAEDSPAETTLQDAKEANTDNKVDALSESAPHVAEDAIPAATPVATLQKVEDTLAEATAQQDVEDGFPGISHTTSVAPSGIILLGIEDTPAESTPQDVEDALPGAVSGATPDATLEEVEDSPAETIQQDAQDVCLCTATLDGPPDIILQDVEDTPSETAPQDAEDVRPGTATLDAPPDIVLQDVEDTPSETAPQDVEDVPPGTTTLDAPPDIILQDVEDTPLETSPQDAEDALPGAASGATLDVTLEEVEVTPAETTQQDAEDALPDTTMDAAPDIILQDMEDTSAETASQDAKDALSNTTSDAHPNILLQDVKDTTVAAETVPRDLEDTLPYTSADAPQDPEDALPYTSADAYPDKILEGLEGTPAETTPQDAEDELPDATSDATRGIILQDVEDTSAETKPQYPEGSLPDSTSDAAPDMVIEDVEDTPAETSPQDAVDALPYSTSDSTPHKVPRDADDTPAKTTTQDAEDAVPDNALQDPRKALQNYTPEDSQGTVSEIKLQDAKDAAVKDSAEAEAKIVADHKLKV